MVLFPNKAKLPRGNAGREEKIQLTEKHVSLLPAVVRRPIQAASGHRSPGSRRVASHIRLPGKAKSFLAAVAKQAAAVSIDHLKSYPVAAKLAQ